MTPNLDMLARAVVALGDLKDEVIFVGGAVVDLFVTDPAAPRPRFTQDVDVVVEVTTYAAWAQLGDRLRRLGFRGRTSAKARPCVAGCSRISSSTSCRPSSACSGSRTAGIVRRDRSRKSGSSREACGSAP
ncbi:MAG: hypothetical protein QM767_19840 [Anaeromyxobacter sp.]